MKRLSSRHPGVAAIIGVGFSLLALATDTAVVSLPALREQFGVGASGAQLTLSVFVAAFAVAQLVYGPLSDRFGRRPTLLAGLAIFLGASLACAFAASIETLIAARFFQALGCCAPTILGRAIVRDVHGAEGTARMMSIISAGTSLLICLWPIAGGQLLQGFNWRAIYALHALMGGGVFVAAALLLPESNRHLNPAATNLRRAAGHYRVLLRDRRFLRYAVCNAFGFSAVMAFLSGAPFLFMGPLGLAAWQFGLLLGLAIFGFIAGNLTTARMVMRVGILRLMRIGTLLGAAAATVMALLAFAGVHTVAALILPWLVFLVSAGLTQPSSMAGAIGPYSRMAGTASALFGFLQYSSGALVGFAVGRLHDGTPLPMVAAIALCAWGMLASYHLTLRQAGRAA